MLLSIDFFYGYYLPHSLRMAIVGHKIAHLVLQKLGAHSTMDWITNQSASEVHCGGARHHLQYPRHQGICTQRWLQERHTKFARCSCDGRSSSLHQPSKGRGDQRAHI
jgi:hypothetical protein